MYSNISIFDGLKYGLIIFAIFFLGKMYSENTSDEKYYSRMIDETKPTQEVWGQKFEGGEVYGRVQYGDGGWKGIIGDDKENEYWIIEMEKNSDGSYNAFDTNGDLFTIHFW